ncbi:MAG: hypothetical protein AABZ30_07485, partial [Myxococcota bacterium]
RTDERVPSERARATIARLLAPPPAATVAPRPWWRSPWTWAAATAVVGAALGATVALHGRDDAEASSEVTPVLDVSGARRAP